MREVSFIYPPRVALFGAGNVGTAVVELLRRGGCSIAGVWSRSPGSVDRATRLLGAPVLELDAPIDADLVLIGATDDAIGDIATEISGGVRRGTVVAHLSGSLGVGPLQPVIARGAFGCAMHPVQACPDVHTALMRLPRSAWGLTCDPEARDFVRAVIIEKLRGIPVDVAEADRALWHAACVMTSNGISALMAFGESVLATLGIAAPESVLGPLASGTVENAREGGGGAATLTGPVVRGESETLRRHLRALEAYSPHLIDDYLGVVKTILSAAVAAERIDDATALRIEGLLP